MPDSEVVRLWRDTYHLNLSASWKHDVDITVTDIELWRKILAGWKWQDKQGKWHRKAPGIKNLLTEYERQSMEGTNGNNEAPAIQTRRRTRVSTRSDSELSVVSVQPPSEYFRVD